MALREDANDVWDYWDTTDKYNDNGITDYEKPVEKYTKDYEDKYNPDTETDVTQTEPILTGGATRYNPAFDDSGDITTPTTPTTTTTNTSGTDIDSLIEEVLGSIPEATVPVLVDDNGDGRADRIVDGETGETILDLANINDYLSQIDLAIEDMPSFDQWLANNGLSRFDVQSSDAYAGLQELSNVDTEADTLAAQQYTAESMGLTLEEYQSLLGQLEEEVSISDFEGFTDEEAALRERELQNSLRVAEERASRMIESVKANTGSATRALMLADDSIRQINDYEIQSRVAMADEAYNRQVANYEAREAYLARLMDYGQITSTQYLNQLNQNRSLAFQAYSEEISAMLDQNAQYLSQYDSDIKAIETNINSMINAVNLELGVNQDYLTLMEQYFEQQTAEWWNDLAMAAASLQLEQLQYDVDTQGYQTLLDTINSILTVFLGATEVVAGAGIV